MFELIDVLSKKENAGYRLSKSIPELFKTELVWIGHLIGQNGIRPLQDNLLAIKEINNRKTKNN